jgi:hypothetical protein
MDLNQYLIEWAVAIGSDGLPEELDPQTQQDSNQSVIVIYDIGTVDDQGNLINTANGEEIKEVNVQWKTIRVRMPQVLDVAEVCLVNLMKRRIKKI